MTKFFKFTLYIFCLIFYLAFRGLLSSGVRLPSLQLGLFGVCRAAELRETRFWTLYRFPWDRGARGLDRPLGHIFQNRWLADHDHFSKPTHYSNSYNLAYSHTDFFHWHLLFYFYLLSVIFYFLQISRDHSFRDFASCACVCLGSCCWQLRL